jgi:predicted  nucleic acid-binding Zn-ribbon protein
MFQCEKCGSRYSAMHAATIENCPRCLARDQTSAPLTFKAFRLANPHEVEAPDTTMPAPAEGTQTQDGAVPL